MHSVYKGRKGASKGMTRNVVMLLLFFGIVPLTVFSLLFLKIHYDVQKKHIRAIQKEIAKRISSDFGGFLSKTSGRIQASVNGTTIDDLKSRDLSFLAKKIFNQGLEFNSVTIADIKGNVLCNVSRYRTSKDQTTSNIKKKDSFKTTIQGMMFIGGIEMSKFTGFPRLHIALPLRSSDGKIVAVIDVGTDFTRMSQVISEQSLGRNRFAYIVNRKGQLIAQPNLYKGYEKKEIGNVPIVSMMLKGKYGVSEYIGLNNEKVIGASTIIPFTGWGVVVEQSVKTAYGNLNLFALILLVILFVTVSSAIFFGLRFSLKRIVRPVHRLQEEAVFMSKGDFSRRINVTSTDELGELATAFNDMATHLGQSQASLMQEIAEREEAEQSLRKEINERKRVEAELREAYDIISKSPAVVFLWKNDEGWPVEYVSNNVAGLFGYTADEFMSGRVVYSDTIHPDDLDRVSQEVVDFSSDQVKKAFTHEPYRIVTKKGDIRWLDDRTYIRRNSQGNITHYQGIVIDITARKKMAEEKQKLESQLQQSQKMEAIGTLAGGIAHDFNNILGIILGNTELSIDDIPESNSVRLNLEEIRIACLRAKDVVRQLLSFARKTEIEKKPRNITSLVEESITFLRSSIPTSIEIRQKLPKAVDAIMADPTQINQVIINLCTNAAQAMPDGGILEVSLKQITLNEATAAQYHDLIPGRYVNLSVSDTGHGISQKEIDRIFDPYFTTKEVGKGTGLGLAVVHGIIKGHNGSIFVESEPQRGTTFNIFFPVVEKKPDIEYKPVEDILLGTERVLFIDDELAMVNLGRQILERLGYQVETNIDPIEALETFRSNPDRFDLVISDMTMPHINGDRLVKKFLKIRADLPIILSTGFSEKINGEKAKKIGAVGYIEKPLDISELSSAIRRVLDAKKEK